MKSLVHGLNAGEVGRGRWKDKLGLSPPKRRGKGGKEENRK